MTSRPAEKAWRTSADEPITGALDAGHEARAKPTGPSDLTDLLLARLGSGPLAFCTGERMRAMPMRRVREVLRLRTAGVGLNEVAPRSSADPGSQTGAAPPTGH